MKNKKNLTGMNRMDRIINFGSEVREARSEVRGARSEGRGARLLSLPTAYYLLPTLFLFLLILSSPVSAKTVQVVEIDGAISPATVDYLKDAIAKTEAAGAEALVIELDTPGGLVDSTKEIVQLFYNAKRPVVVYVAPQGASATSAGLMITLAGHVAVMAPGTNIGASHPVMIGPEGYQSMPKDDVMMEKATNDTVSWVKSICDVRKRNAKAAEAAVVESKSYTAEEAAKEKLVDGMSKDRGALLSEFLNDRVVTLNSGDTVRMETKGATVFELEMTVPQLLQHLINDPNVITILLLLGFLGIAIEFKAPGMVFPALIGVCLVLFALLGPKIPINYAGLLLIMLGFGLLIAEVFITSYGLLSIAGVTALVFGLLMLFDKEEMPDMDPFMVPDLAPSWGLIVPLVIFISAIVLIFGTAILKAHRQKVFTGKEEMAGEIAVAETDIGPDGGKIFTHGEFWNAVSDVPVAKGDKVVIKSVDNLLCRVGPAKKADSAKRNGNGGEAS